MFKEFHNIKFASFRHSIAPIDITMSSVEKLTITFVFSLQSFEKAFPNAKEIILEYCTIQHDFLVELPNVEKLSLVGCEISSILTCTNLKILHMKHFSFSPRGNNKLNGINQLKELVVKYGKDDQEVIAKFLELNNTNLHRLKLIGKNYMPNKNPTLHQIINQNRHKIKHLTIEEAEESD
jgi:hypothetical protein